MKRKEIVKYFDRVLKYKYNISYCYFKEVELCEEKKKRKNGAEERKSTENRSLVTSK